MGAARSLDWSTTALKVRDAENVREADRAYCRECKANFVVDLLVEFGHCIISPTCLLRNSLIQSLVFLELFGQSSKPSSAAVVRLLEATSGGEGVVRQEKGSGARAASALKVEAEAACRTSWPQRCQTSTSSCR